MNSRKSPIKVILVCLVSVLGASVFSGCPLIPTAGLSVSPNTHHFPRDQIVWTFEVWNSGAAGSTLEFEVTANQPWISVEPAIGVSTGPHDRVPVLVTVDRNSRPRLKGAFNSGVVTVTSSEGTRTVAVTVAPDYFTELFSAPNAFDLDQTVITFTPDDSPNFYTPMVEPLVGSPEIPEGVTGIIPLDFSASSLLLVTPVDDMRIPFYERTHTRFFVSEDGYIAFDALPKAAETLDSHFAAPRISAFGADLDAVETGRVFFSQTEDRIVVYFMSVVGVESSLTNTFFVEMFFDGVIRLSYVAMNGLEALVGLSLGGGFPEDFVPSDLSELGPGPVSP